MKPIDIVEWQKATYGSQEEYFRVRKRAFQNGNDNEIVAMNLACMQAICENAGIPYHGWMHNVADCASQRKDMEAFAITYAPNYAASAYEHWITRKIWRQSVYFDATKST